MRWQGDRESNNVEDRRSGGGLPIGGRSIGLGSIVIALIASAVFGVNPLTVLGLMGGGNEQATVSTGPTTGKASAGPEDEQTRFVKTVFAYTEDAWKQIFAEQGAQYREPVLVLYRGATSTACGQGQSAMGPFYCPADERVYIDLGFYDTLQRQLGAPGDFAQAYVVAHEVGHHIQKLTGTSEKVDAMRNRVSEAQYNQLSVRLELQADCYAGVWANKTQQSKQVLEQGDIEEAMNAAAKIGDDALQKRSQGYVAPESFTHGTSEQRMTWFNRGLRTGDWRQCNTFQS